MSEPVRYRVSIPEPHTHAVHVRARFPAVPGGRVDLHLPAWTPGSYLIREFARNVSAVRARDGRGRRLEVTKVAKATWRVERARGPLTVEYEVYANERTVRTSHVTSEHAFLSGPTLFLYVDAHRGRRCELALDLPARFRAACALPERRGRFLARDYDELVDSPVECGRLREVRFDVDGTPFRVVVCGRGNDDPRWMKKQLPKVARAERDVFGSFPFASFLTIVNLTPAARGGLEHAASTALEWPRFKLRTDENREDFLALFAHELFHAWNVKAAAPRAFRPYDYAREAPTRLLWWFEGVTDYYDELVLRRAGLLTPARYLERLVERWERLLDTPGRKRMSVADASYDAWIKYYRPDENSANSSVSYYEKGHLVGLLLDLEVRRLTHGRRSLDDVARLVLEKGGRGLPEDGVLRAASAVAGSDLGRFFADFVHGTAELPLERALARAGLAVIDKEAAKKGTGGAWLGATLKAALGGRVTLQTVAADGPAARAGLSAGDEVLALDGTRVDEAGLKDRLEEHESGDVVRLTFFRDDELRELPLRLGVRPRRRKIVAAKKAGASERETCRSWLRVDWEDVAGKK